METDGKKRKSLILILVILGVLLVVIAAIAVAAYIYLAPSKNYANQSNWYGVTGDQVALYYNNEKMEEKGLLKDGVLYLATDVIDDIFGGHFYQDSEQGGIIYTLPDEQVIIQPDAEEVSIGGQSIKLDAAACIEQDGKLMLSADIMERLMGINYELFTSPGRAYFTGGIDSETVATAKSDTAVRIRGGNKSSILTEVKKGDTVTVVTTLDKWCCVRTSDGHLGYVEKSALGQSQTITVNYEYQAPTYTFASDTGLVIGWDQFAETKNGDELKESLSGSEVINVISPTWFAIKDSKGNISSLADSSYVDYAHSQNLKVWALINDFDIAGEDEAACFQSYSARQNMIAQLIREVKACGADGINVDFEYISTAFDDDFSEFMRELCITARKENLVVSADVYASLDESKYHVAELGTFCDYVVIMCYDEHYLGSNAGSTSSEKFVDSALTRALAKVSADKVICALPFFTRIWTEAPVASNTTQKVWSDGNSIYDSYTLTSEACGMSKPWELLEKAGVTPTWDEDLGQYYGEYEQDGKMTRIWIEDAKSLEDKLNVVSQKNIAGTAYWKLGLETEDVWGVIASYQ